MTEPVCSINAPKAITAEDFHRFIELLGEQAWEDIAWAEALTAPTRADDFAEELVFVICNSGMKNTVARGIYERCVAALVAGRPVIGVFGHVGKAAAIEQIWAKRTIYFDRYLRAPDQLAYLETMPWIGPITKYHAAKNFGLNVAKPDVHLQRLADAENCTSQQLCERLARETGYKVATVDTILWRACANGVISSRKYRKTGEAL